MVVLARPNFLIVEDMRAFLRAHGYEPVRLTHLEGIRQIPVHSVAGVVISTAVMSSIEATVPEVLQVVRDVMPEVPVAFATLVEFEKSSNALRATALGGSPDATLVRSDQDAGPEVALGARLTYLVLRADDIKDDSSPAGALVERHFVV